MDNPDNGPDNPFEQGLSSYSDPSDPKGTQSQNGTSTVNFDVNGNGVHDRIQLEGPKAIKARKRSHSLRTQLFNKNIYNSSSSSSVPPPLAPSRQNSYSLNRDNRLAKIDEPDTTYSSNDIELFKLEPDHEASYQFNDSTLGDHSLQDDDPRHNTTVDSGNPSSNNNYFKLNSGDSHNSAVSRSTLQSTKRIFNKLIGRNEVLPSMGGRTIPLTFHIDAAHMPYKTMKNSNQKLLLDARTDEPYVNNTITSSKYTIFSFIPRQLIAQFSKLANAYFMCVAIMQMIPSWSTTGTTTTIVPLSVFITISILREGFDDLRRHRLDRDENNRFTSVLKVGGTHNFAMDGYRPSFARSTNSMTRLRTSTDNGFGGDYDDDYDSESDDCDRNTEFDGGNNEYKLSNSFAKERKLKKQGIVPVKTKWKNVKVGDIVRLTSDEWIPADVVLLTTSNEMGEAFIETMALDGETNLKSKVPNQELHEACNDANNLANINASLLTEDPNLDLYNFEGSLTMPSLSTGENKTYPLGPDNVIYRGSILRNTDYALGLVIFTGEETKIRMNAIKNPRIKAPKLQRSINMIVIFMVFVVVSLSAFSMMAERLNYEKFKDVNWYVDGQDAGVAATFMGFIIMFNTMIPLSLYVTMEIIKVMQMLLLQWDLDMYDKDSNTPAEARTATILEELGQVSYIFTDKTGTLTDNIMIFRKFSVAGTAWLHNLDILAEEMNGNLLGSSSFEGDERHANNNEDINELYAVRSASPSGRTRFTGRPSMATLQSTLSQQHAQQPTAVSPSQQQQNKLHTNFPRPSYNPSLATAQTWKSQLHQQENRYTNIENGLELNETGNIKSSLELIRYLQTNPPGEFAVRAKFFLLTLALCHSCLPKHVESHKPVEENDSDSLEIANNTNNNSGSAGDIDTNEDQNISEDSGIDYQASSPDELALVTAASDMGYVVFDKKQKQLTLKTYPNGFDDEPVLEVYTVLDTVDFTSARKRMSVVVEFPDGKICMICKGADSIILERLKNLDMVNNKQKEMIRNISMRKKNEAEYVLTRNSMDIQGSGSASARPSMSSLRQSLHHPGSNPASSKHSESGHIDSMLMSSSYNNDVQDIMEQSRKSFQLQQEKKYLLNSSTTTGSQQPNGFTYIPSDQLVMNDEYVLEKTLNHIDEFSTEGLRTLMYAHKWLSREEYNQWAELYAAAKTSLVDRASQIEKVGELLENNFELTGATAIEDKLQKGVPQAIEGLRRAGIRLWMLTGDKRETAINIGYSCSLIKDYSTVVILSNENGIDEISTKITAAELEIVAGNVAHCVVVIDGSTLSDIENDPTLMSLFISLGVKADSVICCRASPSQKASMVTHVRSLDRNKVSLAIGDGANDIAMIQSADVGIGMTGKEGLQAARSSDYSIAQFRFLMKLLLVHGRYNYVRTSKFVLCTFYKEMLFYLTQLVYQRYTLFTGSSLYESWSLSMFNTLFTSLPVLCVGMFEKDLRPSTLLAIPELYSKGVNYESFNLKLFIMWVILATSQALALSFALYSIYGFTAVIDNTTYGLGFILFTVLIIMINTKCNIFEMHYISKVNLASWITSVVGWFVWCLLLTGLYRTKDSTIFYVVDGLFEHFGTDVTFWATILTLTFVGTIIDFIFQTLRVILFPNDTDAFQHIETQTEIRKQMELATFDYLKQSWLWKHESTGEYEDLENQSTLKQRTYKLKSFIRKGSTMPSRDTRKRLRAQTLVNPNEPLPGSPSIVKLASTERYEEEMLPSGKIIRKRVTNSSSNGGGSDKLSKKFTGLFKVDEFSEDFSNGEDIEDILKRRQDGLNEEEKM